MIYKNIIKLLLAIALILCLLKMPYWYYQLIQNLGMVGFLYFAYLDYKDNIKFSPQLLFIAAIIINPIFKISFNKSDWLIVDISLSFLLIATIIWELIINARKKDNKSFFKSIRIISILLCVLVIASIILWQKTSSIEPANELWGIKIGDTKEDVKYLKGDGNWGGFDSSGQPTWNFADSIWCYWATQYKYNHLNRSSFRVNFEGSIVIAITYFAINGDYYDCPVLLKRRFYGYNLKSLQDYFGNYSEVLKTTSGTSRYYCFKPYNVFFIMERNRVSGIGIYDASHINFAKYIRGIMGKFVK